MLLNLYKKKWNDGMKLEQMDKLQEDNIETMKKMCKLAETYNSWIEEEMTKTAEEMVVSNVGKINP